MRCFMMLCLMWFQSIAYAAEGNILIFVSFSMPHESLKGWIKEAEVIHAPMVIRGLVQNSFKETTKKMMTLSEDNQGGVQLDPELFKTFDIQQVPAVVVTNGSQYHVVYGDVHLAYALEKIANQKDGLSSIAQSALKTLREHHHA